MEIDIRDTVANGKTKRGDGERRQHDGELYDDDNDNSDLPRAGKKDKDKEKRFLMSDDTGEISMVWIKIPIERCSIYCRRLSRDIPRHGIP
mmetsp:Transcript_44390/g.52011  ORF Transcript_44390/g.52011 Transcript_44390/m.52011 type:complete len:91 (-) Transcript_44390:413-685(-)